MNHFFSALGHKDCLTAIVPVFNYENPFMLGKGPTPPSDKTAFDIPSQAPLRVTLDEQDTQSICISLLDAILS